MTGSYVFFIAYWLCILMLYTGGKDMEGSQIITLVVAMIGVIGTFVVDIRQSKKNTVGLKTTMKKSQLGWKIARELLYLESLISRELRLRKTVRFHPSQMKYLVRQK